MMRLTAVLMLVLGLAACSGAADLNEPPVPLGNFSLTHNVVVAPKAQKGPFSRDATEDELTDAVRAAIAERFDRYNGSKRYHFGVSVEGYVLAVPGVPLVLSPKSALILKLTVWDDAAGGKLNEEPKQITVLESIGSGTLIGSGYTLSAEEQLKQLSQNAAKSIERYLVAQMKEEGWFEGTEAAVPDISEPLQAPAVDPVPAG
ncbi:MAG: hypothetical protein AAFN94_17740 [Pseudomonadota bacterium]